MLKTMQITKSIDNRCLLFMCILLASLIVNN